MAVDEMIELLAGTTILIAGLFLFGYIYNQTKQGYRSEFGNGIKLYYAAGGAIVLGVSLIYKAIF